MRFPLAWAYYSLGPFVMLFMNLWSRTGDFPFPHFPSSSVLKQQSSIATTCVMLWYGGGTYSCIRLNEPSEHFCRLCEHQEVFMKTSWAGKFVFASQSQEGMNGRIFCMLFWGSEGYLFHCSYGSLLVWAMMWRHAHPIGLELSACLVLPTRYIFYSMSNLVLFS